MYLKMVQCVHKTRVREPNVLLTGEVTGKMKRSPKKFSKKDYFKKMRGYTNILCYEMEVASLFNM